MASHNTGPDDSRSVASEAESTTPSRRALLSSIGAGAAVGMAGCSQGGGGDDTTDGGSSGDGELVDTVYNAFQLTNPPDDLYFNPFGPVAAGMGLYHWAMLWHGFAQYDTLHPERALLGITTNHPLKTDPIEDGTATLQIREDKTWHDGDPYTAQDFATGRKLYQYTLESAGSSESIAWDAVRVVDDYTVEMDMRNEATPHTAWWENFYGTPLHNYPDLSRGPMWVQHSEWESWLQRYEDASTQDEMADVTQELRNVRRPFEETVGHGPWQIREISGQTVIYEPFEEWTGWIAHNWPNVESGSRVGVDAHETRVENDMTAELQFYADRSVEGQAALAGDLDYARLSAESQGEDLVDQNGWELLPLNDRVFSAATKVGYWVNFNNPPLAKRQVRQALLELMPQQQLANIGFQNTQETSRLSPVPVPAPVGMNWAEAQRWLDTDEIESGWSSYSIDQSNKETATALLEAAGLSKSGDSWQTEEGSAFSIDIIQEANSGVQVSRAFESTLDAFGISATFSTVSQSQLHNTRRNGDFDLMFFSDEQTQWPGNRFQSVFGGEEYPWGGNARRDVAHPEAWEVPSEVGNPDSDLESVEVIPMIQQLDETGNDFEAISRELAWVANQAVPNLVYANGVYQPSPSERRKVGQLYNAKNWKAMTTEENYGNYIAGNPGYPQLRMQWGAFVPRRK